MATCGVAFPVGSDTIERLSQAGVGPDVIAAAVTGRYFFLLSDPSDQNIASILTHTQPGSVAPPFTADQKAEVLKATASPEVSAIRALFDRYRSAKNQMTSADDQRRVRLLDALPPDVVASPVSVLAVDPYAGGGGIVSRRRVVVQHVRGVRRGDRRVEDDRWRVSQERRSDELHRGIVR